MNRENLEQLYFDLASQLEKKYPHKSFGNHCYWRIALDQTIQGRWDRFLAKPAYKNLNDAELKKVINLMKEYLKNEELLEEQNEQSLRYREKTKF